MLADGDRGVVLQRDRETYAIAPHLPCGVVTPALLRKIADIAEKYGATLKCTSAERIAIVGLKEEHIDAAWAELGGKPARLCGPYVRSVRACPGLHFCKRARQDALGVGGELDRRYCGRPLPGKMKLGVSGCGNECAETCIKDIALVGGVRGWTVLVGGCGGTGPRLAQPLAEREFSSEEALAIVDRLIEFFGAQARPGERLGELIDRVGMKTIQQAAGV